MTTHLTPEQFAALLAGDRDPAASSHMALCPTCRAQFDAMQAQWHELASLEVPEPSPLFWERFPLRVLAATDAASPSPARWWGWRPLALTATATLAVVVLAAGVWFRVPAESAASVDPATTTASADAAVEFDDIASLFEDLDPDDVLAFAPSGTVSWVLVDDLTLEEREALIRLVERELEALP